MSAATPLGNVSSKTATRSAVLDRLRAEVARLEGPPPETAGAGAAVPLGLGAVDERLPGGGLGRGRVHEVMAGDASAAALGAALWMVSRFCMPARSFLWATRDGVPYAPALHDFGLDPARLIVARCAGATELLWVAEEGLAAPALGAVLAEVDALDATAARRLALAARAGGVPAVLLRPHTSRKDAVPTPAATRWRVRAAPDDAWEMTLMRARGALPGTWCVALLPGDVSDEIPGEVPSEIPVRTPLRLTLRSDRYRNENGDEHHQQTTDRRGRPPGDGPVAAAPARRTA